jgi:uroporphyrin-III C-methyltransferase
MTPMKHAEKGRVYLVGAGPGDPELLTVRAASLLETADYIFHDDLVSIEILKLAHAGATVENVGKRRGTKTITQEQINRLLISSAQSGNSIVRLKAGDPMLFGRAGEEMEALYEASIPFEVVPGITAGFAAASTLQAALTDRRLASKVIFLTGHRATAEAEHWGHFPEDATLVIYMPGSDYARLASQLAGSGVALETPAIVISHVATPREQALKTTLQELSYAHPLPAPCVVLVGHALAQCFKWKQRVDDISVSRRG